MEVIQNLCIGLIGFVVGVFAKGFESYISKKGENLATKEDIEKITSKIESVRADISSRLHVSNYRYEKEYEVLSALASKAAALKDAALRLRPLADIQMKDETEDQRKERRFNAYAKSANDFIVAAEGSRPFYTQALYPIVQELDKLCWSEASHFYSFSGNPEAKNFDKDYWNKAERNSAAIIKLADELVEKIRVRVQEWEKLAKETGERFPM